MGKKREKPPTTPDLIGSAQYHEVLSGISELLDQARRAAARAVNTFLAATYWEVGRRIVELEQGGKARAGIRSRSHQTSLSRPDREARPRILQEEPRADACFLSGLGDSADTVCHFRGEGQGLALFIPFGSRESADTVCAFLARVRFAARNLPTPLVPLHKASCRGGRGRTRILRVRGDSWRLVSTAARPPG